MMTTLSLSQTIHQLHAALDPAGDASPGHRRYAGRAIRRLGLAAGLDRDRIDLLMAGAGTDALLALLVALPRDQILLALDGAALRRN